MGEELKNDIKNEYNNVDVKHDILGMVDFFVVKLLIILCIQSCNVFALWDCCLIVFVLPGNLLFLWIGKASPLTAVLW